MKHLIRLFALAVTLFCAAVVLFTSSSVSAPVRQAQTASDDPFPLCPPFCPENR